MTDVFEVAVPVEQAWAILTDVERIAPCLPGAELKEIEGDEYRGIVKVKVGPITASYKGAARFEELDEATHRAVLKAEGRETRGQGNASATIIATMEPSGVGTKVMVSTDLAITGKVAQFGRGVLADVSGKLLGQFVHNLEIMVLGPSEAEGEAVPADAATAELEAAAADAAAATPGAERLGVAPTAVESGAESTAAESARPAVRQIQSVPAEPVNLVGIAGPSLAKRLWPYASVAGVLFLARIVVYALRRRKK